MIIYSLYQGEYMDLKNHENYQKTSRPNMLSKAQNKTIDFVRKIFGYKIIAENQHVTFLWEEFEQYSARLAVIFIPSYYKTYKDKKVLKNVIEETAKIEAFNLKQKFLNSGFKLPTKKWDNSQFYKFDIYLECYQRALIAHILENYTYITFTEEEIEHLQWYYLLSGKNAAQKINKNYKPIVLNVSYDFKEQIASIPYVKFDEICKKLNITEMNNKHFKFYLSQIVNKHLETGQMVI